MLLTRPVLRQIVEMAYSTPSEAIGCDDCAARLDHFAELRLEGREAHEALPLIEAHIEACGCCHDEFEALMDALRAAERADGPA